MLSYSRDKKSWRPLAGLVTLALLVCLTIALSVDVRVAPASIRLTAATPLSCGTVTFAPPVTYAANTRPRSATIGLLNSDNNLDLVVTNYSANSVSVFLGNSDGTFQAAANYGTGTHPVSVTVADFNEDLKPDLVVANYDSANVTILLGNGDGTFQSGTGYSSNIGPYGVTVGDFDENNDVDVATSNVNFATINVMLGNGNGSLQSPTSYAAGLRPQVIKSGQFNADAHVDLVVPNYTASTISLFLGVGNGTFQAAIPYTVTAFPDYLTVADLNDDTKDDLILSHYATTNNIGVALGNGDGTFGAEVTYSTGGNNPTFASVGDFNGDDIPDLLSPGYASDNVSILLGNGNGTFQPPVSFSVASGSSPVAALAGDFNHDGRVDMFTANENTNDISVFLNTCANTTVTPGTTATATTAATTTPTHTATTASSATTTAASTSTVGTTATANASATSTSTAIPPTATQQATATATACPIQYTDVPEGSTFYSYVRCLACRNIVGGYTTNPPCTTGVPCFLPGAGVTRGQMAKFVSNAAGYDDVIPPSQQTFTDVPSGSTFWEFIERAYLHKVITGYNTAPPCTTGVPCFLPGAGVTRGQTSKFVSIAAGYDDVIPPSQQTFTDVAPDSTFWVFVERVYLHNVVGGYTSSPPCTTGVPCFLPGAGVTRGQISKFISNAFFPACDTLLR